MSKVKDKTINADKLGKDITKACADAGLSIELTGKIVGDVLAANYPAAGELVKPDITAIEDTASAVGSVIGDL